MVPELNTPFWILHSSKVGSLVLKQLWPKVLKCLYQHKMLPTYILLYHLYIYIYIYLAHTHTHTQWRQQNFVSTYPYNSPAVSQKIGSCSGHNSSSCIYHSQKLDTKCTDTENNKHTIETLMSSCLLPRHFVTNCSIPLIQVNWLVSSRQQRNQRHLPWGRSNTA
jgi:hypothetical protein